MKPSTSLAMTRFGDQSDSAQIVGVPGMIVGVSDNVAARRVVVGREKRAGWRVHRWRALVNVDMRDAPHVSGAIVNRNLTNISCSPAPQRSAWLRRGITRVWVPVV